MFEQNTATVNDFFLCKKFFLSNNFSGLPHFSRQFVRGDFQVHQRNMGERFFFSPHCSATMDFFSPIMDLSFEESIKGRVWIKKRNVHYSQLTVSRERESWLNSALVITECLTTALSAFTWDLPQSISLCHSAVQLEQPSIPLIVLNILFHLLLALH